MNEHVILSVGDFVAVLNQTLEYAYPRVTIVGELANFKISKGKWIYFDLKDEQASVRFFGTIYALPGPLEDGMRLQVSGAPRLHPMFGFSVTAQHIQPVGEGAIKKAAELLKAKLATEGLFDPERKRPLPYPPARIGLVTSGESAAYADFTKIINVRWGGVEIVHADVQVQGETAPSQIAEAIERLNASDELDVIVITRGGGSADDLQAFSTELVVRAVAASRTPTLVAIGHEIDTSLAELAADQQASTPSNAAELLVPDRQTVLLNLQSDLRNCQTAVRQQIAASMLELDHAREGLGQRLAQTVQGCRHELSLITQALHGYDPRGILRRGYAWIKTEQGKVTSVKQLQVGQALTLRLADGTVDATINKTKKL
jgi:exodeoxyribonuclease VII large subunit